MTSQFASLASILRAASGSLNQPAGPTGLTIPGVSLVGSQAAGSLGSLGIPSMPVMTSKIGTVFVFGIPAEADGEFVEELLRRCAAPEQSSFLQFVRVADEPFGVAEFRTASGAYRASRALSGLPLLGRALTAVCDKRTLLQADQWKYVRGRELAAQPGVGTTNNILDLVETDVAATISRGRAELLEFMRATELRLRGRGGKAQEGDAIEKLRRKERERIQETLVRQAEKRSALEQAKASLGDLANQVRRVEAQLEANDRELERRRACFESQTARLHGGASLFELQTMASEEGTEVDWEFVLNEAAKNKTSAMATLRVWLEKRVRDALGGKAVTNLVEYVLRRLLVDRISKEEAVLDLKTYLDDEAEGVVAGVHKILIFESLRRRHCPRI